MDKLKLIDETIQVISINKDGKFFEKGTPTYSTLIILCSL